MSNNNYRLILGMLLLTGLYFDLSWLIYALIGIVLFEGLTNLRIPRLLSRLRYGRDDDPAEGTLGLQFRARIPFDAERAWRLVLGGMLILSYALYYDQAWFVVWFMGFAIFGAGLSGVCPLFVSLKALGFR